MAIDLDRIYSLSQTIAVEETTDDGRTAYFIYTTAKEAFESLGLSAYFVTKTGGELKSQAFYNYAKNGSINGVKASDQRYSDDEVEAFIAKMVAKAFALAKRDEASKTA